MDARKEGRARKGWTRAKKDALVRSANPQWRDLSAEWKDRFKPENKRKVLRAKSTPSG